MKILIVNLSDIKGGAARAAYRLHKSLLSQDIDSQMFVQDKSGDDDTVFTETSKFVKIINILRKNLDQIKVKQYKNHTKTLFSPSWFGFNNIVDKINEINPDIVHLHWIGGGMLRIEDLVKIKQPIVWSLHDMWAFTGGCHYDEECNAYREKCGNCIVLGSKKKNDLSRKVFNRKEKAFKQINDMTIIGLSKWIGNCAKNSTLLKDQQHINLPNPINTNIFKPLDKENARRVWNLPQNKKLILFGAMSATSDPRKGFQELRNALKQIKIENVEFVIFGSSKPQNAPNLGLITHYIGNLADDASLTTLYSAVDVMIVPSLQENLSNAIMESLACATPVVAFNIGGNSDMIEHKKNGYLAKPFDIFDLSSGIEWILNNETYLKICQQSRKKAVEEFDSIIVAKKYIKLYKKILKT